MKKYAYTVLVQLAHLTEKHLILADSIGYLDMKLKEYYGKTSYIVKSIEIDTSYDVILHT